MFMYSFSVSVIHMLFCFLKNLTIFTAHLFILELNLTDLTRSLMQSLLKCFVTFNLQTENKQKCSSYGNIPSLWTSHFRFSISHHRIVFYCLCCVSGTIYWMKRTPPATEVTFAKWEIGLLDMVQRFLEIHSYTRFPVDWEYLRLSNYSVCNIFKYRQNKTLLSVFLKLAFIPVLSL